jgi:hypothetical protein
MASEEIEQARLRLDQDRLELEKARLELERSFSRRYVAPLIGILVAIIAGVFALAQVWVASIQKAEEIEAAQIQQRREVETAASERERRWKLDMAEFVFRNREAIFSTNQNAEQQRIFKVIAVTFPADISTILFENLKAAAPEQQRPLLEEGQQLVRAIQQTSESKLYYVIGMTSSSRSDIEAEIARVRTKIGATFDTAFPDIKIYAPAGGGLYTLLLRAQGLPYREASDLKRRAIAAGFSTETWLWQSDVPYFSSKER